MEAAGILPNRPPDSHTMHDGLSAYRKQPGTDSLGHAHHGRELEEANERTHQPWAEELRNLLYEMNNATEAARANAVDSALRERLRER